MAEDKIESAGKPLDKMTVKELREIARDIPDLKGVHAMHKQDLLDAVKAHRGIVDAKPKKASRSIREIKKQIRELKAKKQALGAEKDRKQNDILRRIRYILACLFQRSWLSSFHFLIGSVFNRARGNFHFA